MADGRPQGRPRTTKRRTTIGIPFDLDGWLEFSGRDYSAGMAHYLMELARQDRKRRTAEDPELMERYKAFLKGTGMESELESL